MASRRALVTGAKGVVGRYLLEHLVGDFVFSAEFTEVYQIEVDFEAKMKSKFDKMIYSAVAGGTSPHAA
jgi:nucleoside-diphosphate-sugar epimerase